MEVLYQSGDIIQDKYHIVGILGEGGTAITYEAIDIESNVAVAIKVLSLQQTKDWKIVELFEREVKVLNSLSHPRIPRYLDYLTIDTERDRKFLLIQELVPGKSLASLIESGWYFQEEAVKNIARQVLNILTYLHNLQPAVIHRDIKPHNIIRTDDGKIYLVDLGAVQDVYRNTLTRGATFVGTIDYMSPEQLRGQASFASDLYSLGCTLLYLLSKRSPSELPVQRMKIDFRSRLNISEHFADWLDIMLAPILEDRFDSTEEALEKLTTKTISAIESLAGSKIKIQKKLKRLIINIPPSRKITRSFFSIATEFFLSSIIIIPFSFLVFKLLFFASSQFNFFLWCFTACIWFLFISCLILFCSRGFSLLFLFFGKTKLIIEKEKFLIFCSCLGVQYKVLGSTLDIQAVTITKKEFKNQPLLLTHENCIIYEGAKEHKIGMWLTKAERRWLVTEIANFVVEQYPYKNKEDWLRDIWKYN